MKHFSLVLSGLCLIVGFIFLALSLNGCGDDACNNVDTAQAPDKITRSGNVVTYYWGDCTRQYTE